MLAKRSNKRAFSLIETIVAIVIMSIAVPGMLWTVREAHIDRVNPTLASTARWLAIEKLEDVIADRHSTTRGYTYLIPGNYPAENPVAGYAAFSRTVSLNETLADLVTAGAGYMNVTVQLSWTDGEAQAQTLDISTVLTDYTP